MRARFHGRGGRLTTGLAVLALLSTACGARLDADRRDEAIAGLAGRGGQVVTTTSGSDGTAATGSTGGTTTTTGSAGTAVGETGSTTTTGSEGGTASTTTTGSSGSSGSTSTGTTGGGQSGTGGSAGTDTRSAPPGGNGGATDIGVTETQIIIGNGVDNSGAVPGIFLDAQQAMQAFVAWFNATEGTIYGRQLVLDPRDTRLDAGANREVYLGFCESAFAAVGSMSAFDEGVVGPVTDCKIPDIRSAVVNPRTMAVPTIYSADAISASLYPTNHYLYWDGAYPGAKEKAGILYVDNDTTKQQTRIMRKASESVGYKYVVDRAIGLAETNYSTYVIELKDKGVTFVEFQGDAPQVVRLAKAMRQQGYWPDVFALQQNVYKPALIQQGGVDVEGIEIALGSVMNENIASHPELQTYRQWLKQVAPDAEPTGQGSYSWTAGLLLVKLLKQIGPDLTREKLVAALSNEHDFDGNGLVPSQDIGRRIPTNCHIVLKVAGGKFVPVDPPGGKTFVCRGKNADTT